MPPASSDGCTYGRQTRGMLTFARGAAVGASTILATLLAMLAWMVGEGRAGIADDLRRVEQTQATSALLGADMRDRWARAVSL